jgi:hypothetical protein
MRFSVVKRFLVAAFAVSALVSAVGCGPIGFGQDGATTNDNGGGSAPLTCASTTTGYNAPVDVYVVAPAYVAAWWYVGQEPADVSAGEQYIDDSTQYDPGSPPPPDDSAPGGSNEPPADPSDPPADPPADPGDPGDPSVTQSDDTSGNDAGSDASDDGVGTDALHPKNLGGACYSCDLTCTLQSPDVSQPAAIRTAHGTSAHSQGAACADAERTLRHYASSSYGLNLNSCGYTTGT